MDVSKKAVSRVGDRDGEEDLEPRHNACPRGLRGLRGQPALCCGPMALRGADSRAPRLRA